MCELDIKCVCIFKVALLEVGIMGEEDELIFSGL
jgi:hypothetical protein